MFRLWSEWNIGEDNLIFASREAGIHWLYDNAAIQEMAAEERAAVPGFVETLFADGYLALEAVEVIQ